MEHNKTFVHWQVAAKLVLICALNLTLQAQILYTQQKKKKKKKKKEKKG